MVAGMAIGLKRLLAVSWAFPPLLTPRSLQVGRLLDALAGLGWTIDVLTVAPASLGPIHLDPDIVQLYNSSLGVYAIPDSRLRLLRIALGKIFPTLRPLPDPESGWAKRAVKAGTLLLASNDYAGLVSFAQPWSSHIVGQALSEASGLPWLAHFSDPWADNPYYVGLQGEQREFMQHQEANVVSETQALVFTNQITADFFADKYGSKIQKKINVLPHAYDQRLRPGKTQARGLNNRLYLVYIGSLYGLRNPETLIRALAALEDPGRILIEIAGPVKTVGVYRKLAENLEVGDSIQFSGNLTYRESLQLAARADVLLLIDAPVQGESPFLPSKLVDYLMFRKPILGITPTRGASANLLRRLGTWQVDPDDMDGIRNVLALALDSWENGTLSVTPDFKRIAAEYESGRVAQKFDKVLETLLT